MTNGKYLPDFYNFKRIKHPLDISEVTVAVVSCVGKTNYKYDNQCSIYCWNIFGSF